MGGGGCFTQALPRIRIGQVGGTNPIVDSRVFGLKTLAKNRNVWLLFITRKIVYCTRVDDSLSFFRSIFESFCLSKGLLMALATFAYCFVLLRVGSASPASVLLRRRLWLFIHSEIPSITAAEIAARESGICS